jgi:hypothetical protein
MVTIIMHQDNLDVQAAVDFIWAKCNNARARFAENEKKLPSREEKTDKDVAVNDVVKKEILIMFCKHITLNDFQCKRPTLHHVLKLLAASSISEVEGCAMTWSYIEVK